MFYVSDSASTSDTSSSDSNYICHTANNTADATISDFVAAQMNQSEAKISGRPKGSSNAAARSLEAKVEAATSEAALELIKLNKDKSSKKILNKGSLKSIIEIAKAKHDVDDDYVILSETVRQRVKQGSASGHVGQTSPMAQIEPYLVELILKLAALRTPITASQGLQLANSLIKSTKIEKFVTDWKSRNCHAFKVASKCGKEKNTLSLGYWRSFMKWNAHLIRAKKGVKFDNKRAEWCNYLNIEEMYEEIYQNPCIAGHACEHPEPLWRGKNGNVVEPK
jgi:hypothetical protein